MVAKPFLTHNSKAVILYGTAGREPRAKSPHCVHNLPAQSCWTVCGCTKPADILEILLNTTLGLAFTPTSS